MGLRSLIVEALRASCLLTSNGKDEIIQSRDRMHLKGACFLSRQWGDPQNSLCTHLNIKKRAEWGRGINLLSGLSAYLIAFIAVCCKSLRAAASNPVESLRYE